MDKAKVKLLREFLLNVSANFDGIEEYIKNKKEEICSQEKISVEKVMLLV